MSACNQKWHRGMDEKEFWAAAFAPGFEMVDMAIWRDVVFVAARHEDDETVRCYTFYDIRNYGSERQYRGAYERGNWIIPERILNRLYPLPESDVEGRAFREKCRQYHEDTRKGAKWRVQNGRGR